MTNTRQRVAESLNFRGGSQEERKTSPLPNIVPLVALAMVPDFLPVAANVNVARNLRRRRLQSTGLYILYDYFLFGLFFLYCSGLIIFIFIYCVHADIYLKLNYYSIALNLGYIF